MNKAEIAKEIQFHEKLDAVTRKRLIELRAKLAEAKPRYYKWQPGKFYDRDDSTYAHGYLSRIDTNLDFSFVDENVTSWKHFEPDLTIPSLPNWVEHDGESMPDEDRIFVECRDGLPRTARECNWLYDADSTYDRDILRYCILPPIEWL